MRERPGTVSPASSLQRDGVRHVPYDERTYFESHYRATAREGPLSDRHTIGHISEPEARFHYNAVENSIIRAVLRRSSVVASGCWMSGREPATGSTSSATRSSSVTSWR